MKHFILAIAAIFFGILTLSAQDINKSWQFEDIQNETGTSLFSVNENDVLELKNGEFKYSLAAKDNLRASGDYIFQNNLLVFYYNTPNDTIRRYKITEFTDSTLVFKEKNIKYSFSTTKEDLTEDAVVVADTENTIIPSQGFSFNSLWRGILGMVTLIFIAFLFSSNRRAVNWRTVAIGLAFQLVIAIGVLKIGAIKMVFEFVGKIFIKILSFTQAGSEFLFGGMLDVNSYGFIFAFQVLPTILFFSALTSVLFYLGIIQKVVQAMGWLLSKVLGISGAESLSVAGNIFLGQTEAPLLIKAYLEKMNKSEMLLVMIGGMATVAGAVLAAYIGFLGGDDEALKLVYAKHLLAASVMAAPGAIVISKILFPQTEKVNTDVNVSQEKIGSNFLDAIANGTTEGLKLAVNVGAMLLVFVAFIAMINYGFGKIGSIGGLNNWIAENTPYQSLSLELILGYIFAPLMWLIGSCKRRYGFNGTIIRCKISSK